MRWTLSVGAWACIAGFGLAGSAKAAPPGPVDLGKIRVARLSGTVTISLCTSSFDTEIAVWDQQGNLLAQNDDSLACAGLQSYLELSFLDETGVVDPALDGTVITVGVAGFDTVFGPGFSATPIGSTDGGTASIDISSRSTQLVLFPGQVGFVTFTLTSACPSCGVADVAEVCGELDINDILLFADAFDQGSPAVDIAPAFGELDINDILVFAESFDRGCP